MLITIIASWGVLDNRVSGVVLGVVLNRVSGVASRDSVCEKHDFVLEKT